MPESLLTILKLLLLALIYLFFLRVLRAVWAGMHAEPATAPAAGTGASSGSGSAAPAARGGTRAAARLKVVDPPDQRGTTYDLTDEITVGRASGCHVSLNDATVSQLHARVFRQDGKIWVEDLGSRNGTYVNRKQVTTPTALRRGDRLAIGSTVLEVSR